MDKLELITKEIKELKLYLTNLYTNKKNKTQVDEKLEDEIEATSDVIDILKDLKNDYQNGIGDTKLTELTKDNDLRYYELLSLYKEGIPKEHKKEFIKEARLKERLDNINEIFLSKDEIYNYLYNYSMIMRLARQNEQIPLWDIFIKYMQNNDKYNANFVYYSNMIKIHNLYDNLTLLSIIKDEDFEDIDANDKEMSEKDKTYGLSFLKNCFINPTDSTRFKKHHIFNYVRNAVFHNDINELYKVSSNGENIYINLKMTNPIPFKFKINVFDIYNMMTYISSYTHNAPTFMIKNQKDINIESLKKNHNRRMRELNKLVLTRIKLTDKITKNKGEIINELQQNNTLFSSTNARNILNKYSNTQDYENPFSKNQKDLYSKKIEFFLEHLDINFKYYVAPILYNYMQGGIYKYNYYVYDSIISELYLIYSNNSIASIKLDLLKDFDTIFNKKSILNKDTIFNYINKNIDYSKSVILYTLDNDIREDMNDAALFTYAMCSLNNQNTITIDGKMYEVEHIRNAFTHGRWICNRVGVNKYYSLYDDEDMLIEPNSATWQATFNYEELLKLCNMLRDNYIINNNNSKSLTKN